MVFFELIQCALRELHEHHVYGDGGDCLVVPVTSAPSQGRYPRGLHVWIWEMINTPIFTNDTNDGTLRATLNASNKLSAHFARTYVFCARSSKPAKSAFSASSAALSLRPGVSGTERPSIGDDGAELGRAVNDAGRPVDGESCSPLRGPLGSVSTLDGLPPVGCPPAPVPNSFLEAIVRAFARALEAMRVGV